MPRSPDAAWLRSALTIRWYFFDEAKKKAKQDAQNLCKVSRLFVAKDDAVVGLGEICSIGT